MTAGVGVRPAKEGGFELLVEVRVAVSYHIYGKVGGGAPFQPLAIDVDLPEGFTAVEDWQLPAGKKEGGSEVFYGKIVASRRFQGNLEKEFATKAVIRYQCCNEEACLPPGEIELEIPSLR